MAGVKRRTKYRKGVAAEVLDSLPEPKIGERIVRVLRSHGSNILEVETNEGETGFCLLPTKFRKLVWVKRGDFMIVSEADSDYDTKEGIAGRVRFMTVSVLFPQQIKHLQRQELWPACFAPQSDPERAAEAASNDNDLFDVAPNRNRRNLPVSESSSESDSDCEAHS